MLLILSEEGSFVYVCEEGIQNTEKIEFSHSYWYLVRLF